MNTAIVWFRRDLRLADNPALTAAATADRLLAVYVHAPEDDGAWRAGAASDWWLAHSLEALDRSLRALGSRLLVLRGPAEATLLELAAATGATRVHWNRLYEPAAIARDTRLKSALREAGVEVESANAALLFEPWAIKTGSGEPYRVFTPFWRSCQQQLAGVPGPLRAPRTLPPPPDAAPAGLAIDALGLRPTIRWDAGLAERWVPGEAGALARLEAFCEEAIGGYGADRNRPDLPGTSRLSPYLHFGEVSPRQALAAALRRTQAATAAGLAAGAESFVRELGWREFAHHLLYHFPLTPDAPMDRRFADFAWREDPERLHAWQRGRTGYPIVDAGMRQLWHTGWMHNRVRMIVASLLTKNIGVHWREGVRWFHDTLVDADLANNVLGWQWVAGCGADASPYYRIFNPILQSERFDPSRRYLREWLPELAALPDEWIHRPWEAPTEVLAAAGVRLGRDYPEPIVDFRASRERALESWGRIRGETNPVASTTRKAPVKRVRARQA